MTTNNGAIIQQLNAKQQQFDEKIFYEQDEITDDARLVARQDAIKWGKAYKKYLADYKEQARIIIHEKILKEKDEKLESLDLDESLFFGFPSTPHIG